MKKEKKPFHSIRKPNFLGGNKAFIEFLDKHLVYPKEALENKIEGLSFIKCEISDRGKVLSAHVANRLGYGLDEEAERLCLLMPFENTEERGMKIKHTKNIRIQFTIPPPAPSITFNYETTTSTPAAENKDSNSYNYTIRFD